MTWCTADLWDEHGSKCRVVDPLFRDYGKTTKFWGRIRTVKFFEDNSLLRQTLEEDGTGYVLVADGGGSLRCAVLGDRLAELGRSNGWNGIIVYGAIRDSDVLKTIDFGVKALNTNPRKSVKRQEGQCDITVTFGGVEFEPGDYIYSDADGILVSNECLL